MQYKYCNRYWLEEPVYIWTKYFSQKFCRYSRIGITECLCSKLPMFICIFNYSCVVLISREIYTLLPIKLICAVYVLARLTHMYLPSVWFNDVRTMKMNVWVYFLHFDIYPRSIVSENRLKIVTKEIYIYFENCKIIVA